MPCIFCLAVFALFAGAITEVVLDQLESRLESVASEPVARTADSASVLVLRTAVRLPGADRRSIPVSVTVYKKHRRIRIQVLTHDITRSEAEAIEDLIASTLELRIVDRSDAHDEQKVREAFGENEQEAEAEAAGVESPQPARTEPEASQQARSEPRSRN
jgi:hypothetical protein